MNRLHQEHVSKTRLDKGRNANIKKECDMQNSQYWGEEKNGMNILIECHLVGLHAFLEMECIMVDGFQEDFIEDGATLNLTTLSVNLRLK